MSLEDFSYKYKIQQELLTQGYQHIAHSLVVDDRLQLLYLVASRDDPEVLAVLGQCYQGTIGIHFNSVYFVSRPALVTSLYSNTKSNVQTLDDTP